MKEMTLISIFSGSDLVLWIGLGSFVMVALAVYFTVRDKQELSAQKAEEKARAELNDKLTHARIAESEMRVRVMEAEMQQKAALNSLNTAKAVSEMEVAEMRRRALELDIDGKSFDRTLETLRQQKLEADLVSASMKAWMDAKKAYGQGFRPGSSAAGSDPRTAYTVAG